MINSKTFRNVYYNSILNPPLQDIGRKNYKFFLPSSLAAYRQPIRKGSPKKISMFLPKKNTPIQTAQDNKLSWLPE